MKNVYKQGASRPNNVDWIEIDRIHDNPNQPRILYNEDELQSLTESIRKMGVISPIIVCQHNVNPDDYLCVSGHRRLRAAKRAGHIKIPVIVREITDKEMLEINVVENEQRSDLNPLEKAIGFQRLIKSGHTQKSIGELVGKSRAFVANSLRLLEMDPFLLECVLCGTLEASKALLISIIPNMYEQYHLGDIAMDWGLSRREIQGILTNIQKGHMHVSWIRKVPVAKLREHPMFVQDRKITTPPDFDLDPLSVDTTGCILDARVGVDDLVDLGYTRVKAEVIYFIDYLKKGARVTRPTQVVGCGLAPDMTKRQRKKMERLRERLSKHERTYPVNALI